MLQSFIQDPASYRDPSGFVFRSNGILYRQVNRCFREHFDHFIQSGCYDSLVKKKWLIPHKPIGENLTGSSEWYATLQPQPIPFISYPYEWSFDMLKDAALLTLQLMKEAMGHGMILKDATPYNIQWLEGRLVFIDTLSFEKYQETEPWIAYRQFCEQFLGPLLLMHYNRIPLHSLQLAYPEGVPLQVTSSLLPAKSKWSLHPYLHIHLNARVSAKNKPGRPATAKFSKRKLLNLLNSLETLVGKLKLPEKKTAWSAYYEEASRRDRYLEDKKAIIREWLPHFTNAGTAADLGSNEGEFSRILSEKGIYTVAADFEPYCINHLYLSMKRSGEKNLQPLLMDLSNPSPAAGLNNEERLSFTDRFHVDIAMALALVHHLAIGKNIPLEMIAELFQRVSRKWLIIEFVPKTDDKIQLMLSVKKDIYENYTVEGFERVFRGFYDIINQRTIGGSGRVLYLMKKHGH